ncbi:hypothetical protein HKCCE3408_03810 [Rhodobacterales bacterium HKCCE3408]|nr:hypothetical protein [Rhodobacterales bacterium HKCCE3408]
MTDDRTRLTDEEIRTVRPGRRRALGLMAAGSALAFVGGTATAQAADADNGTWTDQASCPRGNGGTYTGLTDSDDGAITDAGGYGRGAPTC